MVNRTCRFLICFLTTVLLQSTISAQSALDELVDRDYDEEKLSFILGDLNNKYEINIRFNETLLPISRHTYSFDKVPMGNVLNIILSDKKLGFLEYAPDRIIIIPEEVVRSDEVVTEYSKVTEKPDSIRTAIQLGQENAGLTPGPSKISGMLVDDRTLDPIPNALIRNITTGDFVISKGSGKFEFEIFPGLYSFQVSNLSHETLYESVRIFSSSEWEIKLEPKTYFIDEVVISVKSADHAIQQTISGLEILSKKDIKQLTSFMGEADVVKSLLTLAGVSTSGDGSSGFNVRGGSIDQNLILQDGAIIFNPSHVLGFFSTFNPDIVQSTSLNKGHIPAYYGGRVSSVLDVDLKEANFETFKFNGGLGLISSKLSAEIPVLNGKSSLLLSGRASYAEWMLNRVEDLDVRRSSANFHDMNAKYSHKLSEKTRLIGSYFRSFDKFLYSNEFGYSWRNEIGTIQVKHIIGQNTSMLLNTSLGTLSNNQFEPEGPFAFNLSSGLNYWQTGAMGIFSMSPHTFRVGVDFINYRSKKEELTPLDNSQVPLSVVPKENGRESAIYINDQWEINDRLSVDVGLRYSLYQQIGPANENQYENDFFFSEAQLVGTTVYNSGEVVQSYTGVEPRISLRYKIVDNLSLKLSYNRMYQYIHLLSNTSAPTPVDIWQVSNLHIKPLGSQNFSAGLFQKVSSRIELSLDTYYRKLENTIDHKDFASLLLNSNLETSLLLGEGRAYGAELSLVKNGDYLTGRLSYSYARSQRKTSKTTIETINKSEWFPSNFDQPHSVKLFLNWQISKRDRININFTYSTGRPITAPIANYTVQGVVIADFSDRNAFRIPDYHRLDLGYTFSINRSRGARYKSDLSFSIYNLYARKNAFSIFYRQQLGSTVNALRLSVIGSLIPSMTYNFQF